MGQNGITAFTDDIARAAREVEVPAASFLNGCNLAAGACGIGIGIGAGAVTGAPEKFTLLDQHGNARVAQISQNIGGPGYTAPADYPSSGGQEGILPGSTIFTGANSIYGDGSAVRTGSAALVTLEAGWIAQVLAVDEQD